MPYQIAGIDVHKKMLAVVVADVEVDRDYHFGPPASRDPFRRRPGPAAYVGRWCPFERLKVGTSPAQLRALADWLVEREVEEVVMESTAPNRSASGKSRLRPPAPRLDWACAR
jgi:hypothetical protein